MKAQFVIVLAVLAFMAVLSNGQEEKSINVVTVQEMINQFLPCVIEDICDETGELFRAELPYHLQGCTLTSCPPKGRDVTQYIEITKQNHPEVWAAVIAKYT